jgi:hypothetical protein
MSFLPDAFFCDCCGVQKRDVNHWWNLDMQGFISGRSGDPASQDANPAAFILLPFDAEVARQSEIKSICGQHCAHKMMDEYMNQILSECK